MFVFAGKSFFNRLKVGSLANALNASFILFDDIVFFLLFCVLFFRLLTADTHGL